jgi:hypothetical protein
MTDLWQEATALARSTAEQMRGKVDITEYRGNTGRPVEGWTLKRYSVSSTQKSFSTAIGDWEETWGDHELVLGNDGNIYDWQLDNHEYGEARKGGYRIEISKRLTPCTKQQLLRLGPGKPFATLTEMLQRLPYS